MAKQKPKKSKKAPAKAKPKAKAKPAKATTKAKTKRKASNNPRHKLANHEFLKPMYADTYFPKRCVDKVKGVLNALCVQIETQRPPDLEALYRLTHAATDQINDLQDDFDDNDSEIETAARDAIAAEFTTIAKAYGFDADMEELIATRDW